jgi:hypothetical protein
MLENKKKEGKIGNQRKNHEGLRYFFSSQESRAFQTSFFDISFQHPFVSLISNIGMTKRQADLASTSTDDAKRQKTRLVLPDGCMVNIQAKTPNDGHQAAHEVVLYIYTG